MSFSVRQLMIAPVVAVSLLWGAALSAQTEATDSVAAEGKPQVRSTAWRVGEFGQRIPTQIDTLLYNYYQRSIPSMVSDAYATTGNLGAAGLNMIWDERQPTGKFFFADALRAWVPSRGNQRFYNTRIPMTLVSYNFGGGRENEQNRLQAVFSGNVNKRLQFGARLDYLYSKGSYNYQATNDLSWGVSGSYIGERWQIQLFYDNYNFLNKDNGGITDALYITDPAQLQGGDDRIDAKSIPTKLSAAHTRLRGGQLFMNNRFNIGHWREEQVDDSTVNRTYVPVMGFLWTFDWTEAKHMFLNENATEGRRFWENFYITPGDTRDDNSYWSVTNTVGVELIEGFNRWVPFSLTAYVRHEARRYNQVADTVSHIPGQRPEDLTPWPEGVDLAEKLNQQRFWVGGRIARTMGKALRFDGMIQTGISELTLGCLDIDGTVETRFRLLGDTVSISGNARFSNNPTPTLYNQYISNHFVWQNSFGKIRRLRFGGALHVPHTGTRISVAVENVQNHVYFNPQSLPEQCGDNVQVFSARLEQDFRVGILNWRNRVTFQTSSNDAVIPLPKLAVYSNLYLRFKVARVLDVQLGVDCDYYTSYYAPGYQPALMSFYNQREVKCGNYPFMNVYANMTLWKARFYVMMTHVNQGLFSKDYFSMPLYPLNPRRFQLGVSVDFAN